jgi:hypothetical protein
VLRLLKNSLLLLHLALPLISFAQSEVKPKYAPSKIKHLNKTDEFGRKQGVWMAFNLFSEKISETPWVNDHKEGVEKKFFPLGKIREEQEYLGGIKDGTYNRYFFSGQVEIEGQYAYGRKDGKWTKYYEDGTVRMEGNYKNGKKDGVWKTYNRKGAVTNQVTYKDDVDMKVLEDIKKKELDKKAAADSLKNKKPPVKGAPVPATPAAKTPPPGAKPYSPLYDPGSKAQADSTKKTPVDTTKTKPKKK